MAVAAGIGALQFALGRLFGVHAANLAIGGAVCASLADVPNTLPRTWQRVAAAALLSMLASAVVAGLQAHPIGLGVGVMGVGFTALMAMAWGSRANSVAFAPVLALVFSMAAARVHEPVASNMGSAGGLAASFDIAVWMAVGATGYLAWALAASALLQPRYRRAALSEALEAATALFRSRAALLSSPSGAGSNPNAGADTDTDAHDDALRAWIHGEVALGEQLQSARDFVFAAPDTPASRRETALLLRLIDLRDALVSSRLDLDLLGGDAPGRALLARVAAALTSIADSLARLAEAVRAGTAAPASARACDTTCETWRRLFDEERLTADDPRARLVPAISNRLQRLREDVEEMQALWGQALWEQAADALPLTRAELQNFVAAEGWPWRALRAQWSPHAPVFRHAVRTGLALGLAYFIALALPWASHPHWLVLSVAVVLRGTLEQTLARRNGRVLGTLLGCVAVLLLAEVRAPALLGAAFLVAVGTAHSFLLRRYWIAAAAATVMALLQAYAVHPQAGFAVGERAADTLLGALLAWGFSYVLPSWERGSLPQGIARLVDDLRDYAAGTLRPQADDPVRQRLARRRAYDSLAAVTAAVQRSQAEPRAVRLPVRELAVLLDQAQRLLAHLSMVRLSLAGRWGDASHPEVAAALRAAAQALSASLAPVSTAVADTSSRPMPAESADALPLRSPSQDVVPWLLRRLQLLASEAEAIRPAARNALAAVAAKV